MAEMCYIPHMSDWNKTSEQTGVCDETDFPVPPDCRVRFYNDDYTTKDFVVGILVSVFHKPESEAVSLMETVHRTGSAVIGTYTYDIAVTRCERTRKEARTAGFPLRVELENA